MRLYIHRGEQNLDRRVHYVCTVAQNRPGPGEGFWLHIQVLLNQAVLIRKTIIEVKRDAASGGRRFHDSSKEEVRRRGTKSRSRTDDRVRTNSGRYISHISYIIFSQTKKFL